MIRDEDYFDAVGKDDLIERDIELSVKYPQYLNKWVMVGLDGEVLKVSDHAFPYARKVKYEVHQLPKNHPDWGNPLF